MNLYEHTIVTRQDMSASEIKQIKISTLKLFSLRVRLYKLKLRSAKSSYVIKKNKKGNYIHLK